MPSDFRCGKIISEVGKLMAKERLKIPKTAKGEERKKLSKPVVGHELLLASANGAVEDEWPGDF